MKVTKIIIALLSLVVVFSCTNKVVKDNSTKVYSTKAFDFKANYSIGDTILPDYAIPDTLIVIDAKGLNKELTQLMKNPDFGNY